MEQTKIENQFEKLEQSDFWALVYKDGSFFNNKIYTRKPSKSWVGNSDWKIVKMKMNIVYVEEIK
jgi:hypothetical protein